MVSHIYGNLLQEKESSRINWSLGEGHIKYLYRAYVQISCKATGLQRWKRIAPDLKKLTIANNYNAF